MRGAAREVSRAAWVAALALVALFLQAWPSIQLKSPTFDEPAHIAAGLSYLRTGDFKINLQHPPLLKEIAALPLVLNGTRFPVAAADWDRVGSDPDPALQWDIGGQILEQNDPERIMLLARLPFLLLTLLLVWTVFAWGREMLGPWPAAGAALLCALDPAIVSHGVLVTTDTGFALCALLFVWALWRYLNHRSLQRLIVCGLCLGAGLGAKFSGVLLLPLAVVLLLWATRLIPSAVPRQSSTLVDPYASEEGAPRIVWCLLSFAALLAIATVVVELLYFLPRNPFLYLRGIGLVNADHDPTYFPYLAGGFAPRFWSYYVAAYLLKEPLPAILLALFGGLALLRRGSATPVMEKVFLLLPPAALFLFYTLFSHNLGFRYVIPALPFLHLAGGVGARALWESGSLLKRAGLALLGLWLAANAWGIQPDQLSFFNETACLLDDPARVGIDAGSACGPMWLDDSNVDWGQGLKQLKAWLDANASGRRIGLAYFGTSRPEAYGIVADRVVGRDLERGLAPGLYAVSAHLLARTQGRLAERYGRGPGNWIRHVAPVAVVGHAYVLYEIGAPNAPPAKDPG
jgi:hypothetical protein